MESPFLLLLWGLSDPTIHLYIIHLINWLQRFYRIIMSLKRPFILKSDVKQWFTTTTSGPANLLALSVFICNWKWGCDGHLGFINCNKSFLSSCKYLEAWYIGLYVCGDCECYNWHCPFSCPNLCYEYSFLEYVRLISIVRFFRGDQKWSCGGSLDVIDFSINRLILC